MKPVPSRQQLNLGFKELKARQRRERGGYSESVTLRVHRAISWLGRAEQEHADSDSRFVFLWIAFNAAYASGSADPEMTERRAFRGFLNTLLALDAGDRLGELVWNEFAGSIRVLLDNRFVFPDFWSHQVGKLSAAQWSERFRRSRREAHDALARGDTLSVLVIVFGRIYVLRNQVMHGGATWNSRTNRSQVRDCANFLGKVVPAIIEIMMEHPRRDWGPAAYPVVEGES